MDNFNKALREFGELLLIPLVKSATWILRKISNGLNHKRK